MPATQYTLRIDHQPASSDLLAAIEQVEVEEHADMADMLRLRLAVAVQEGGSGWTVVDDDIFRRLTPVELRVAVGASLLPEPLITAYVIETHVEFSNQPGRSVLNVVAMDSTALMNLEEKNRAWPNMADSDIATLVFGEYGLLPQVTAAQPTRPMTETTTLQRGTDIQFLRHLARRNGYECYVETNALTGLVEGHFHPPRLDPPAQGVLSVHMHETTNVNSFQVRYDMLRPTLAQVVDVDIATQSHQQAQAERLSLTELGRDTLLGGDHPRRTLLSRSGLFQTGELQTYAQAVTDRSAWAITAEGELNAAAYGSVLRAKRPVLVRGAGRQFSGTYYVEKVLHTFTSDSYTQRFTLRRNALGLQGTESFMQAAVVP